MYYIGTYTLHGSYGNINFELLLWALFSGRVSRQLMLGAKKQATNDRGHCHLAP